VNRDELAARVDSIVVVMMENRSFDHVLGHLRSPDYGNRSDVDGIEDVGSPRYINPNSDGEAIAPFWTDDASLDSDLPHDPDAVAKQLAHVALNNTYAMNGFVRAFEDEFHTQVHEPAVMGLLKPGGIPTTAALAGRYTVCDNWFACIPTSTAPNRLMSMCGTTDHRDTGVLLSNQQTVYDWLLAHGVRWRVYSAGLPFFTLMPRLHPLLLTTHFRRLSDLPNDMAHDGADWPQVIFVEPDYYDCPIHFDGPCDNHPPLAMAPGEAFLSKVYGWLTSDAARWAKTALIVTYDEHGGFFDHVPPLPVRYRNPNGVAFDTTGPRVPTIVAGPFAPRGVSHAPLDNTSILQLLAERFGKAGETYSSAVAGRMNQGIASVSSVLTSEAANVAPLPIPSVTAASAPTAPVAPSRLRQSFQQALVQLANAHQAEAYAKYPELRAYLGR
jgi:phospholipase C